MVITQMRKMSKPFAFIIALSVGWVGVAGQVNADVLTTEALYAQQQLDTQRSEVKTFLARDDVKARLLEMGVSPADVDSRIDNLSADEIQQLHENIDAMPTGEGFFGVVISLLVIFILLDIAGVTDIFPRV